MYVCVCVFTLSNMNISASGSPITTRSYLNNHWGGGKAALGLRSGRIRTLVPMAIDISYKVLLRNILWPL